jgi:MGT family glycosyltransferase
VTRFLLVVPPLAGHVNPLVGVAAELARRGHEVAWAGAGEVVRPLAGKAARVFPCAVPPIPRRPDGVHGFAALAFLWEQVLVPLAEAMEPGVRAAVDGFTPDVLVVDQQAVAGALVAGRVGLPWATSASTSSELAAPLAGLPKVDEWLHGLMRSLQESFGDPRVGEDLRFSRDLVLAFTTPALAGAGTRAQVRFVGPSIDDRAGVEFPRQLLDPARRLVLVTVGTVNSGARFLGECAAALRARSDRIQAIIVDPGQTLRDESPDVITRSRVPLLELMERAEAVICHAGHNTVCEALHHGVPLVVAPITDDQPIVAEQVVRAGAGIRLRFTRATARHVGDALDTVLDDASYRAGAARVRESFRAAGGAAAAAESLEELARSGVGCTPSGRGRSG